MCGTTYGTRTSCTLPMTCLPIMMTDSCWANSIRHPPGLHCNQKEWAMLDLERRTTQACFCTSFVWINLCCCCYDVGYSGFRTIAPQIFRVKTHYWITNSIVLFGEFSFHLFTHFGLFFCSVVHLVKLQTKRWRNQTTKSIRIEQQNAFKVVDCFTSSVLRPNSLV